MWSIRQLDFWGLLVGYVSESMPCSSLRLKLGGQGCMKYGWRYSGHHSKPHASYSVNSIKGCYIGDYMGDY